MLLKIMFTLNLLSCVWWLRAVQLNSSFYSINNSDTLYKISLNSLSIFFWPQSNNSFFNLYIYYFVWLHTCLFVDEYIQVYLLLSHFVERKLLNHLLNHTQFINTNRYQKAESICRCFFYILLRILKSNYR